MSFLLTLHSHFRFIIFLVLGIFWLFSLFMTVSGKGPEKVFKVLRMITTATLDLQWLLGLIVLLWTGFATSNWHHSRFEHLLTMTLALVSIHLISKVRIANKSQFFSALVFSSLSIALILTGIYRISGSLLP